MVASPGDVPPSGRTPLLRRSLPVSPSVPTPYSTGFRAIRPPKRAPPVPQSVHFPGYVGPRSVLRRTPSAVSFGLYTDAETRARSVLRITSHATFDGLGHPLPGGLYDSRLGPLDRDAPACRTCGNGYMDCPGHFGHVDLCVPVYHPLLFNEMMVLLKAKCLHCHLFRLSRQDIKIYEAKLHLLSIGRLHDAKDLDARIAQLAEGVPDDDDDEEGGGKRGRAGRARREKEQKLRERVQVRVRKDRLLDAALSRTRDGPPRPMTQHERTERQNLIKEFTRKCIMRVNCANCDATSPKIRQNSYNKIFRAKISDKGRVANRQNHIRIRSALETEDGHEENHEGEEQVDSDDENEFYGDAPRPAADKYMTPLEVEAQVRLTWNKLPAICAAAFGTAHLPPDADPTTGWTLYFLRVLAVPPSRFRPPCKMGSLTVEHAQNLNLIKIMELNHRMALLHGRAIDARADGDVAENVLEVEKALKEADRLQGSVVSTWIELQATINGHFDASRNPKLGADEAVGIRQLLEKKEGMFRKHMMGKRVNYACRSVISPDPYIGTNEIGLPLKFAQKLTYPCHVTAFNVAEMRKLVANGTARYPGAVWVQDPHGKRMMLTHMIDVKREAIANRLLSGEGQYVVGRQIQNGDMVLMNRQPTLHKPGIMAHQVRILYNPLQQTIRMHYANCNTYNADFDGDEMNCHLPQDQISRSEAKNIVHTDLQYIVPTDGSPLRGLIQDHVDGGVRMCAPDTFLEEWEYQQLLFAALASLPGQEVLPMHGEIDPAPPAIRKPRRLWTGKQVVTALLQHLRKSDHSDVDAAVLPGISVEFKAKTPPVAFGEHLQEHLVLIRDGELLRGVLDKKAFGASEFSLVHAVQEAYGPLHAGLLLNALGRLFTAYLQYFAGHSCRVEDLVLTQEADAGRRKLVEKAYTRGMRAAKAWADSDGGRSEIPDIAASEDADVPLRPFERAAVAFKLGELFNTEDGEKNAKNLDSYMQNIVNPLASDIIKRCLPHGLAVPFPENTFSLMVNTGAKGSTVNQSQVSCALGQQALEGQRVPRMPSGKTLPSFAPYDPSPRSDGFIADRFLTGIRPQEYYFHCMAGREGLVDTAVKTSRSGYLQRCLIKHLEDLTIAYDNTVRDSDGSVVQFLYGEDGIDPTKAAHLDCSADTLKFMIQNSETLRRKYQGLPDGGTLKIARADAKLAASPPAKFAPGVRIQARRLRLGASTWARSNLRRGWHSATVEAVLPDETLRIVYTDGTAETLPATVQVPPRPHAFAHVPSGTLDLVRRAPLPDPILSSPGRGHRAGVSGACVSEAVADVASKLLRKDEGLRKEMERRGASRKQMEEIVADKFAAALAAPGEAVGCIAGQSVGEPSTQMTLNTFHLAGSGANVTLGIPRLREIIMSASRKPKTPTMSVPVSSELGEKEARRLMHRFTKLTLRDLLASRDGVVVTEALQQTSGGLWERAYQITLRLHPEERMKTAFGLSLSHVAEAVADKFIPAVSKIMKTQLRKVVAEGDQAQIFVEGGQAPAAAPKSTKKKPKKSVEDEYDDHVANEEEGVTGGRYGHRKEMHSYGDMDDEDQAMQRQAAEVEVNYQESDAEETKSDVAPDDDDDFGDLRPLKIDRANDALVLHPLSVDPAARPLLMVDLVERAAGTTVVRARPGIDEAYLNTEISDDRGRCLQTLGANLEEIWALEERLVDHKRLLSNDIWALRCHYGVEAARQNIVQQIRAVFAVYGISVDPRHLMIIADYMTYDGDYKPMNRYGMARQGSEFLKMSYETTMQFLVKAALQKTTDPLINASSNIVMGQPVGLGTGAFECAIQP